MTTPQCSHVDDAIPDIAHRRELGPGRAGRCWTINTPAARLKARVQRLALKISVFEP